jgi:molecular chaperone GrpE
MIENQTEKEKSAQDAPNEMNETAENSAFDQSAAPDENERRRELEELKTALYIKELESKVATYESKLSDIREYVKKNEEEVKQIRFRSERDAQKNIDQKISQFFISLLPIADNLERSLQAASEESGALVEGLRLIFQQVQDFLAKSGLEKIDAKGSLFDPSLHEAVGIRPVDVKGLDEAVVDEVQSGYKYKDQVIRPAQVIVGKLAN